MHQGSLALLLHAHLPWVRHPEHEEFLEEDWLFEAILECYIPLLKDLRRLVFDKAPVKLTFTLTPPLCSNGSLNIAQSGGVRVNVSFTGALSKTRRRRFFRSGM